MVQHNAIESAKWQNSFDVQPSKLYPFGDSEKLRVATRIIQLERSFSSIPIFISMSIKMVSKIAGVSAVQVVILVTISDPFIDH